MVTYQNKLDLEHSCPPQFIAYSYPCLSLFVLCIARAFSYRNYNKIKKSDSVKIYRPKYTEHKFKLKRVPTRKYQNFKVVKFTVSTLASFLPFKYFRVFYLIRIRSVIITRANFPPQKQATIVNLGIYQITSR